MAARGVPPPSPTGATEDSSAEQVTGTVPSGGPALADPRDIRQDEVVVLDYGGQYSQLIARRVRECGVFSELLPHHVGIDEIRKREPRGLILSGGPA